MVQSFELDAAVRTPRRTQTNVPGQVHYFILFCVFFCVKIASVYRTGLNMILNRIIIHVKRSVYKDVTKNITASCFNQMCATFNIQYFSEVLH